MGVLLPSGRRILKEASNLKKELKLSMKRIVVMGLLSWLLIYFQKEIVIHIQNFLMPVPHSHNISYPDEVFQEVRETRALIRLLTHIFSIPAYYWILSRIEMVNDVAMKAWRILEEAE